MPDSVDRSRIRLIDVDSSNWTAEICLWSALILVLSTDGMVEDEDANRAGAGSHVSLFVHLQGRSSSILRVLQQLLRLGIIFDLELVVVHKFLLLALVVIDLEAMAVKRVRTLITSDVFDNHGLFD
jgi:hypothetical protein